MLPYMSYDETMQIPERYQDREHIISIPLRTKVLKKKSKVKNRSILIQSYLKRAGDFPPIMCYSKNEINLGIGKPETIEQSVNIDFDRVIGHICKVSGGNFTIVLNELGQRLNNKGILDDAAVIFTYLGQMKEDGYSGLIITKAMAVCCWKGQTGANDENAT